MKRVLRTIAGLLSVLGSPCLPAADAQATRLPAATEIVIKPPAVDQLKIQRPSFSPSGALIGCTLGNAATQLGNDEKRLYGAPLIIDTDTHKQRLLMSVPGAVQGWYGVSWRPDSREIAMSVIRRSTRRYEVWVCDVKADKARQVSPATDQICQRPLFSNDGRYMVFHKAPEGGLALLDVKSCSPSALAGVGSVGRLGFAWSKDADGLWAASSAEGLVRATLGKKTVERVADVKPIEVLSVAPDGLTLACLVDTAPDEALRYEVGLVDAKSGSYKAIDRADEVWLEWSADGRKLAYAREKSLCVYEPAQSKAHPVTAADAGATEPFWHPKEHTLWCVVAGRAIARVNESGLQKVFNLDDTDPTGGIRP